MDHPLLIRDRLEQRIQQEEISMSRFAKQHNINVGIISSILNGNRVLSIEQLDKITEILELEKGALYDQYINEYLNDATPDWRRIKPFLYRCVELDKLDCIQKIVHMLAGKSQYPGFLFETAEDFFREDKKEAASMLYESVAESENKQHSERLAVCHYRLFMARQGDDQEQNYQLAIRFEPFVERLNEVEQLDAYTDLANTYRSLRNWKKVEKIAEILLDKARLLYDRKQAGELSTDRQPQKPWFFYIAYAYLLRAHANEEYKDYEQVAHYLKLTTELDWVQEEDDDTLLWKNRFEEWARANSYAARLYAGEPDVLEEYVEYVEQRPEELLVFLLNVVTAANRHRLDLNTVLPKFKHEIDDLEAQTLDDELYTLQLNLERYARLLYELAVYYLERGQYGQGFGYLLECMEQAQRWNYNLLLLKCTNLFERFRGNAEKDIVAKYAELYQHAQRLLHL